MLVLTRKLHEVVRIGDQVTVRVLETSRGGVKLGITAPPDVPILREELYWARRGETPPVGPRIVAVVPPENGGAAVRVQFISETGETWSRFDIGQRGFVDALPAGITPEEARVLVERFLYE